MCILLIKLCKWTFPWLFKNFRDFICSKDFSRPVNNLFLNSVAFLGFHDRTNPDSEHAGDATSQKLMKMSLQCKDAED